MKKEQILRRCIVCGKDLKILVDEKGEYTGGHYFGRVEFPVGDGENISLGKTNILDFEMEVVDWTGDHEEVEYWECEECFNET